MATSNKATYAPPSSQVDLEYRQKHGNESDRVLSTSDAAPQEAPQDGRDFAVEGNDLDAYVNVNPEYMTYANETEAPAKAEKGPEKVLEESGLGVSETRAVQTTTHFDGTKKSEKEMEKQAESGKAEPAFQPQAEEKEDEAKDEKSEPESTNPPQPQK